uniref:SET domain-containing protein n=1 Tax=Heterorhabditis bacteriophora TaxID=37862 RepID=A0A1I7WFR1_HETBA
MAKEGACCPAQISFRIDPKTGQVETFYQLVHYGHAKELDHAMGGVEDRNMNSEGGDFTPSRPIGIVFPEKPIFIGDRPMQYVQIDLIEAESEGFSCGHSITLIRDVISALNGIFRVTIKEIFNETPDYDSFRQRLYEQSVFELHSRHRWAEMLQFTIMSMNQSGSKSPFEVFANFIFLFFLSFIFLGYHYPIIVVFRMSLSQCFSNDQSSPRRKLKKGKIRDASFQCHSQKSLEGVISLEGKLDDTNEVPTQSTALENTMEVRSEPSCKRKDHQSIDVCSNATLLALKTGATKSQNIKRPRILTPSKSRSMLDAVSSQPLISESCTLISSIFYYCIDVFLGFFHNYNRFTLIFSRSLFDLMPLNDYYHITMADAAFARRVAKLIVFRDKMDLPPESTVPLINASFQVDSKISGMSEKETADCLISMTPDKERREQVSLGLLYGLLTDKDNFAKVRIFVAPSSISCFIYLIILFFLFNTNSVLSFHFLGEYCLKLSSFLPFF